MERLHNQQEHALEHIRYAAIAIKQTDPGQLHIGLLFHGADSPGVDLLHLAWHCDLRNEPANATYLWVDPNIPDLRLRQVAAACRQVRDANPGGIPYGFDQPNDNFDAETHEALLGPTKHGLTCATFVLAVFQHAGIPLVDLPTWPSDDPSSKAWQESIIDLLQENDAPSEHCDAVSKQIGAIRVRPEQATAAAAIGLKEPLLKHQDLNELSTQIVAKLEAQD